MAVTIRPSLFQDHGAQDSSRQEQDTQFRFHAAIWFVRLPKPLWSNNMLPRDLSYDAFAAAVQAVLPRVLPLIYAELRQEQLPPDGGWDSTHERYLVETARIQAAVDHPLPKQPAPVTGIFSDAELKIMRDEMTQRIDEKENGLPIKLGRRL